MVAPNEIIEQWESLRSGGPGVPARRSPGSSWCERLAQVVPFGGATMRRTLDSAAGSLMKNGEIDRSAAPQRHLAMPPTQALHQDRSARDPPDRPRLPSTTLATLEGRIARMCCRAGWEGAFDLLVGGQEQVHAAELAHVIGCSAAWFRSVFQRDVGIGWRRFTLARRMNRAREVRDSHPQYAIRAVAKMAGYRSEKAFIRAFHDWWGAIRPFP
jgi:AraC-like DNA-binding protein